MPTADLVAIKKQIYLRKKGLKLEFSSPISMNFDLPLPWKKNKGNFQQSSNEEDEFQKNKTAISLKSWRKTID